MLNVLLKHVLFSCYLWMPHSWAIFAILRRTCSKSFPSATSSVNMWRERIVFWLHETVIKSCWDKNFKGIPRGSDSSLDWCDVPFAHFNRDEAVKSIALGALETVELASLIIAVSQFPAFSVFYLSRFSKHEININSDRVAWVLSTHS